jgi:CubicO group peptidase (beta-lactamase class C family)
MKLHVPVAFLAACIGCGGPGVAAPCTAGAVTPPATQPVSPAASSVAPPTAPSVAPARPSPPAPPATFDLAAIDDYIARQTATGGFVGLSVAIVKDGAIVLDKGYGQSHLAPDVPVQPDTSFLIGSITKQLVASLVLLLADEKRLSLADKVARYFPDLTRARDITLYDLMTHVSGYHDDYPLDFVDQEMKKPITADESIALYARRPLDFEPRTRFSYSSTGYKILGRVIEKVTGKPLGVVLEERILRPLGMTHSFYMPKAGAPGLASGYTSFALGPPEPAEPEGQGWHFGSSGLWAPAGDIARWSLALMSGKVLTSEAYKLFGTPRRLADGRMTTYGCGIGTSTSRGGDAILSHGGGDAGFRGAELLVPRTHSAVIVLSNRDDADPWAVVTDIARLLDKEHRPPPLTIAGPPAEEVARALFAAMQSGQVDRSRLGEEFNVFLTDAKLRGASARLRALGAPTDIRVDGVHERGGMEAATVHFTFASVKVDAVMYRSVDGHVQQFLMSRL